MATLPKSFEKQMQALLAGEYAAFMAALDQPAPVSIRRNARKQPQAGAWSFPAAPDPVAWHPGGQYLMERPVFTLDPLWHAGAYYVQEASSMFLYEALRQTTDFSRALLALDLCAAPGGKSTLLADMLPPGSLLVSNEVVRQRAGILRENLERWGFPDLAVCSAETTELAALGPRFDIVVADAPCSGEGLFRKDPDAIREWSPAHVESCAIRQRLILANAVEALAPGGVLAYSTCTFNRQEDEDNAAWLQATFGLEPLRLELPAAWHIVEAAGGYRFFPHRVRGEGFFIALFRKTADVRSEKAPPIGFKNIQPLPKKQLPDLTPWLIPEPAVQFFQTPSGDILALPENGLNTYTVLDKALKNKWFGTRIGAFKGKDFIPDHALALSVLVSPTLPAVDLTREQALRFLKKETFNLPDGAPTRGWALARYGGLNLGWLKALPNRWNNYLPNASRIRMEVPPQ